MRFLFIVAVFLLGTTFYVFAADKDPKTAATSKKIKEEAKLSLRPALLRRGKVIYRINCVLCHGQNGDGKTFTGMTLSPRPRDLRDLKTYIAGSDLESIIKTFVHGLKRDGNPTAMAGFPEIKRRKDQVALAHFVRSFDPSTPEHKMLQTMKD